MSAAEATPATRPIACQLVAPRGRWVLLCTAHGRTLFPRNAWSIPSAVVTQGRAL